MSHWLDDAISTYGDSGTADHSSDPHGKINLDRL